MMPTTDTAQVAVRGVGQRPLTPPIERGRVQASKAAPVTEPEESGAMDERSSVRGQYRLDDAPGLQHPSSAQAASRVDLEADN
jgi:hypothetical protein